MNTGVNRRERSVSFAFFANHGETGMEISEAARRQRGTTSGELEKCLPKKKFQVKTKLSDGLRSRVSSPFDLHFLHVNSFYKKNKKILPISFHFFSLVLYPIRTNIIHTTSPQNAQKMHAAGERRGRKTLPSKGPFIFYEVGGLVGFGGGGHRKKKKALTGGI